MRGHVFVIACLVSSMSFAADLDDQLEANGVRVTSSTATLTKESDLARALRDVKKLRRDIVFAQKKYEDLKRAKAVLDQQIGQLNQQSTRLNGLLANVTDVATNNRLVGAINTIDAQLRLAYQRKEKLDESEADVHSDVAAARDAFVAHVMHMKEMTDEIQSTYGKVNRDIDNLLHKYNAENGTTVKLAPTSQFDANARKVADLAEEILTEEVPLRREGNTYWAAVEINGNEVVEMVVDSGASFVALPYEVALKVGLKPGRGAKEVFLQVADGRIIEGHQVTAKSMRLGIFTATDVECVVLGAEATNSEPLLGMTFLGNFKFEIDAGKKALVMTDLGDNSNVKRDPSKKVASSPRPSSPGNGIDIQEVAKNPAAIEVKHYASLPVEVSDKKGGYSAIPKVFEEIPAIHYGDKKSDSKGFCEFQVLESGYVMLACNYHYEGNSSGGWTKDRWLKEDFIKNGWKVLDEELTNGKLVSNYEDRELVLFVKHVEKGESFKLRCNKYSSPRPILFEK